MTSENKKVPSPLLGRDRVGLIIEHLSFHEMLLIVQEKKRELEAEQSLDPRKADTVLTATIEEFRKLEIIIVRLKGNRIRV